MMRFGMSLLTCVALSFSGASHGQTIDDFISEQKVTASDGASIDYFGQAVSISGDTMVVGSYADNNIYQDSGSAYIYERAGNGTWSEVAKLIASDTDSGDLFGYVVSISGDTLVVGAPQVDDNGVDSGSAYIYERAGDGTWSAVAKLTASDAASGDLFGLAVSISGDRVVVGSYADNENGLDSGTAYIYERAVDGTWPEVVKLTASDGFSSDYFGNEVAISGDTVLVGAPHEDNENGFNSGSAYIYERAVDGTWPEVAKLTASDGAPYDYFGHAVSISGDTIVVGAYRDDFDCSNCGSAYVFERNTKGQWIETQKLFASDAEADDYYGLIVSLSGDTVVVGAAKADDNGTESGSAYIYEQAGDGTWSEVAKLTASDGSSADYFGQAVSISGDWVVVGGYLDDNENGSDSGSAYVFEMASVLNLDYAGKGYTSLAAALSETNPGDHLAVRSKAFAIDGILNTTNLPLNFIAVEPIVFSTGLMFLPADGTAFVNSDDVDDAGFSSSAQLIAPEGGELIFSSLEFLSGSQFHHNESSIFINEDLSTTGGSTYLYGDVFAASASTDIDGVNRVAGDTNMFCDYTNDGSTIIQRGILYIYGDLVNNGILTGEYNNGFKGGEAPEPGDGFNIGGSYTIGQDATLSMPNPVWWLRVGGNLDIAIDDPMNFGMSEATIELNGLAAGKVQAFEAMSADLGADEAGFDSSNFPIGTLRIGGDSNAQVVNNHANSTGAACEVVYANELVVEFGGYLATGGCTIYTRSATINGEVDDPDSIVIIDEQPPCLGDLNNDGTINGADLGLIIAMWGTADGDLTGDGTTNGADLGLLIAGWGLCN